MQHIIDNIATVVRQQMNTLPSYGKPPQDLHKNIMMAVERELVLWYLQHNEGNQQMSAKQMGIHRNTFMTICKRHNIDAHAMKYGPWEKEQHHIIQKSLYPSTYRFNTR